MDTIQTDVRPHAVRDFLSSKTEQSRPTYRLALRRALSIAGKCKVGEIDPAYLSSDDVLVNFKNMTPTLLIEIARKLQKKYSQRTAALTVSTVKGVMDHLETQGLISADHLRKIQKVENPKIPKDEAERRFLESDEVQDLKRVCSADKSIFGKRDHAIIAWMLSQGPRCSEVVNANLEDYNRKTGVIMIRNSKGMKSRKNQLHNGAKKAMDEWIRARGKKPGALFSRVRRSGEGFKNLHMVHENMTPHAVTLMLRKRAEEAGVKRFTPHALRRTAGEALINAGVPIVDVATILGHADLNTTRDKYTRKNEQRALEAGAGLKW